MTETPTTMDCRVKPDNDRKGRRLTQGLNEDPSFEGGPGMGDGQWTG